MKKLTKVFLPITMAVISIALLTTASFAWFSMNRQVSATDLAVTVRGPGDLKIAYKDNPLELAKTEILVDQEEIKNTLAPVSSCNGLDFFFKDSNEKAKVPFVAYDSKTLQDKYKYAETVVGYIDLHFTLYNTSFLNHVLGCSFKYDHSVEDPSKKVGYIKAMRSAVFIGEEINAENLAYIGKGEYGGQSVSDVNGTLEDLVAPNSEKLYILGRSRRSDATELERKAGHLKVTVRLWIEGNEDTITRETFKTSDGTFNFSVDFKIIKSEEQKPEEGSENGSPSGGENGVQIG